MIIIPYVRAGALQSNSMYHFHSFQEAIMNAYDEMIVSANKVGDVVVRRYRILDTEEDFEVKYVLGDSESNPEVKFYIGQNIF